jgi:hypothetical protein
MDTPLNAALPDYFYSENSEILQILIQTIFFQTQNPLNKMDPETSSG